MAILVDIRKIDMDLFLNKLVDAAKIRTKWWGKKSDNYWSYLDDNTENIVHEINPHIMSDLFVYLFENLKYKELLTNYSDKLTALRKHFVALLVLEDRDNLMDVFSENNFSETFEVFLKELNAEYYNYQVGDIEKTINNFKEVLKLIDVKYGLLINIG